MQKEEILIKFKKVMSMYKNGKVSEKSLSEDYSSDIKKDDHVDISNPSTLLMMIECDEKAQAYCKRNLNVSTVKKIEFSTFESFDTLDCHRKRPVGVKKIGDQRSIVEYLNFYDVKDEKENCHDFVKVKK